MRESNQCKIERWKVYLANYLHREIGSSAHDAFIDAKKTEDGWLIVLECGKRIKWGKALPIRKVLLEEMRDEDAEEWATQALKEMAKSMKYTLIEYALGENNKDQMETRKKKGSRS